MYNGVEKQKNQEGVKGMFKKKEKKHAAITEKGYRTFADKDANHWHGMKNYRNYHADFKVF